MINLKIVSILILVTNYFTKAAMQHTAQINKVIKTRPPWLWFLSPFKGPTKELGGPDRPSGCTHHGMNSFPNQVKFCWWWMLLLTKQSIVSNLTASDSRNMYDSHILEQHNNVALTTELNIWTSLFSKSTAILQMQWLAMQSTSHESCRLA